MRIHEIRLRNFRAFKDLTLHLEPQLTVLIGRNGAGKTTVLEGLAVALGAWLSGFKAIHEDHPIPSVTVHASGRTFPSAEGEERLLWVA